MTEKSQSDSGPVMQPTDDVEGSPSTSVLCTSIGGVEIFNPATGVSGKDDADASPVHGESTLGGKYAQAQEKDSKSSDTIDAKLSG